MTWEAGGRRAWTSSAFDALCVARAGVAKDQWSVAGNGAVIEQAQILTTHNLAALTGPFGVGEAMTLDWNTLADTCFERVLVLAGRLGNNPRPLRTVKDLAYAWRQMIFYLARLDRADHQRFVQSSQAVLAAGRHDVRQALRPGLDGLVHVLDGGRFDDAGNGGGGRRLLGWTVDRHWILDACGARVRPG